MPSSITTYTPTPEVKIDGTVPDGLTNLLVSMTVEESVAGMARCEIRLDNWGVTGDGPGYVYVDRSTINFGATVDIAVGPPDERATIFSGRITGIEGEYTADAGPTMVILAEDALQDLRMTRRSRTFEDLSDADIVSRIASDHGLTADVDLDGPTLPALCQLNESDLAFLRERALPYGADVWLDGTTLHVGRRVDEPVVLRYGRELLELRVLADVALQATEQRVAGWDPDTKEAVLESADQSSLGAELGSDMGGGGLLAEAFGDRLATTTLTGSVTSAEARAVASGLFGQRARRFITGSGAADGIGSLRAGRAVALSGLGAMFDGTYRLSRVVHRFDLVNGYRTDIDVERTGLSS